MLLPITIALLANGSVGVEKAGVEKAGVEKAGAEKAGAEKAGDAEGYVAHEWGTFNQFEGADGLEVDGLQHEDEALPSFVHHRFTRTPSPFRVYGDDSLHVRARHANTKMETPVIYFHASRPQRVHVDVTWNGGVLSEWYPRAPRFTPDLAGTAGDTDIAQVPSSSLSWDLQILDPNADANGANDADDADDADDAVEKVPAREPWGLARDVDANLVRDPDTGETEKYVFYRGIGAKPLCNHVYVRDGGDGRVVTGDTPAAILLEVGADGGYAWNVVGKVAPVAEVDRFKRAPKKEAVAALSLAMKRILIEQGLYDDEAQAMINTWTRTWFERPGRRLLSIVPSSIVDAQLPLTLTPAPAKLVRVFIARTEYQTQNDLDALIADVVAGDRTALAQRGRFLEPMLRVALRRDDDAAHQRAIRRVLADLAAE